MFSIGGSSSLSELTPSSERFPRASAADTIILSVTRFAFEALTRYFQNTLSKLYLSIINAPAGNQFERLCEFLLTWCQVCSSRVQQSLTVQEKKMITSFPLIHSFSYHS